MPRRQEWLQRGIACLIIVWSSVSVTRAEVKPAALFADNMVLQRDLPLKVWGQAEPGEKVFVSAADRTAQCTADAEGRWLCQLEPLASGGPIEMTIRGQNTLTLKNVLVGDVWVAGGQSNMEMKMSQAEGGEVAAAAANDPQIRLFKVGGAMPDEPSRDLNGNWQLCTPDNVKDWTAAGYFFASELRKSEGVPIGLLQNAMGWTPAEAWTSREALVADPQLKPMVDTWDRWTAAYPHAKELHDRKMADWKVVAERAKAAGQKVPPEPEAPWNPRFLHHPSLLYNGMLRPLMPYGIRGAIWYQGETNASRADQYRRLFPTMIADWRKSWGQGDFPFIFVQIAPLGDPGYGSLVERAELRDAQRETLRVPNTAMVVTVDIGERYDEHPKNKSEVGRRLALAAQKLAYGKKVVASGPVFKSHRVEGRKIRLSFIEDGSGLVSKPSPGKAQATTRPAEALTGFVIAGKDQEFVPAEAHIEGAEVVVSSRKIAEPVAVRYAWANFPEHSLFNQAGLPASPFRTDNWRLSTQGDTRMIFEQIPLDEETLLLKEKK